MRTIGLLLVIVLAGCGSDASTDAGDGSAGLDASIDATSRTDGSALDAPLPLDAATALDVGPPDVGLPDTGPPDAGVAPPLYRPVDTDDLTLARQALGVLGSSAVGGSGRCSTCHGITRQRIRHWRALTDAALTECLTDLELRTAEGAQATVSCIRGGTNGGNDFPSRIGVFAMATNLAWFEFLFQRADPATAMDAHRAYDERVSMPPMGAEIPRPVQRDVDVVVEWLRRGAPRLENLLPEDPPPTSCSEGVSSSVAGVLAASRDTNWQVVNAERPMRMFGCTAGMPATSCLSAYPLHTETTAGAAWSTMPTAHLRVLHTTDYATSYWTRSSHDGRFVAHGSRTPSPYGSRIIDLTTGTAIMAAAAYDPAFFPDDSGFALMGPRGHFCSLSVLTTGSPTAIDFTEPGCVSSGVVGLYEHLGSSLGGQDDWALSGEFESDNGGHQPTLREPNANFSSTSTVSLVPMINTGSGFAPGEPVSIAVPYEGDVTLSPSARFMISRVGATGDQQGFLMRELVVERTGMSARVIRSGEVARYCIDGGKPAFSLDERYFVVHHYVVADDAVELGFSGPSDPEFAPYLTRGASNLYLVDVATGHRTRIVTMPPGAYALYPHFRNDGWIYFVVRHANETPEYIVASDAALIIEG